MPVCAVCGIPAVVTWQRQPTAAELAAYAATLPVGSPAPSAASSWHPMFACAAHAISLALAAEIHQSTCTAPNPANIPACDCTPTALPTIAGPTGPALPTGW